MALNRGSVSKRFIVGNNMKKQKQEKKERKVTQSLVTQNKDVRCSL